MPNEPLHIYVRRLREARGGWLTQRRLAALAGIAAASISRLERGETAPTARTLRAIARYLNTTEDDLLQRAGYRTVQAVPLPPADPQADTLAALRGLLADGAWPPALADALHTILALTANDSRALWEARFDAAMTAMLEETPVPSEPTLPIDDVPESAEGDAMFGVTWRPVKTGERAELMRVTRTPTPAQWLELRNRLFGASAPSAKSHD